MNLYSVALLLTAMVLIRQSDALRRADTRKANKEDAERETRQAIRDNDPGCQKRWPNAYVPYRLLLETSLISSQLKENIETAANTWEEVTCLKLEDVTNDRAKWEQPMLLIETQSKGCQATIGRDCTRNGQLFNLDPVCHNDIGVIIHEFGHAFGLYHQHARPDRDQYLNIKTENIKSSRLRDFAIKDVETYGVPYDYMSIMQYGKYTASKEYKPTMETPDPLLQFVIGSAREPSHYDTMLVNIMYNCSDHCTDQPTCQNGGFVNKFCKCQCPHNTEGDLCETVTGNYYPTMYDECGDQVIESDAEISSYNFPNAKPYARSIIKCMWYLKAPAGKKAQLTFNKFDLYNYPRCRADQLDIMLDLYTIDQSACGKTLQGETVTSPGGSMMLVWTGRTPGWRTGFHAFVTFIDDV